MAGRSKAFYSKELKKYVRELSIVEGFSCRAIAAKLRLPIATVYRWSVEGLPKKEKVKRGPYKKIPKVIASGPVVSVPRNLGLPRGHLPRGTKIIGGED